ncbi:MAG: 2TM domain-containing protein [Chloroflexi bacterium]|nr:2TM domain-containing protein [Chloroflexota bacterium]
MPLTQDDLAAFLRAEQQVHAKMRFYTHAVVFAVGNITLLLVVLFSSMANAWLLLPFVGWSIGFVLHFLGTFTLGGSAVAAMHRRMIEHELMQEQQHLQSFDEDVGKQRRA